MWLKQGDRFLLVSLVLIKGDVVVCHQMSAWKWLWKRMCCTLKIGHNMWICEFHDTSSAMLEDCCQLAFLAGRSRRHGKPDVESICKTSLTGHISDMISDRYFLCQFSAVFGRSWLYKSSLLLSSGEQRLAMFCCCAEPPVSEVVGEVTHGEAKWGWSLSTTSISLSVFILFYVMI